jgi:Tol biopolymer transport system component
MAHQVFICHASSDKQVADAACAALEAQRIPCWIAPRDILAGEEYQESIVDALSGSPIVLLIFSAHANDSPQVRREIERAVSKGKIVVPFRIEDVMPSRAMEFALSNTHWLDAFTPPLEHHLTELCRAISRLLQKHKEAEPPLPQPREQVTEESQATPEPVRATKVPTPSPMRFDPAVAASQPVAQEQQPAAPPPAASRARFRLRKWPVPGLVLVGLAAAVWLLRPALPPPEVTGTTQLTQDGARKTFVVGPFPMFTDGSRVYFQEVTPDNGFSLMQVSTEGGEPVPLDVPFKDYHLGGISPNGHELLLLEGPVDHWVPTMPLWRLSLPGLQPQRIGNLAPTSSAATWSPDGSVLYYASNPDIFAADADGSHPRKLLTAEGNPYWIRVSPDGRLLRFSVLNPKNSTFRLWEAHSDGSGLRELLPGFSSGDWMCCGDWTADGRYFVFEDSRGGAPASLWAMRDAGDLWRKVSHEPVQLTHGEIQTRYPLPSRDGKKIFFIGSKRRGEVMRYDLGTHTLTPFRPGFSAQYLSFTKDGQRMAYVSYPQGILWQSRTDGSDRHQLTFPPMGAGFPRWSPDGSQIVFSGGLPGKTAQVFVIPAGGGDPEQVTAGDVTSGDATWSPDGNSLAYASGPWDPSSTLPLHIVNLKTRQVTDVPNSAGLFSPRWSPDGRYLLAMPMNESRIMLYDFNLRIWQQLTQGEVEVNYPVWTPDGKCVYFNWTSEKGSPEYRICLGDRKVQHVADMGQAGNLLRTSTGWWTGLAPDGSILGLRDTSSEEIYALDVKFP